MVNLATLLFTESAARLTCRAPDPFAVLLLLGAGFVERRRARGAGRVHVGRRGRVHLILLILVDSQRRRILGIRGAIRALQA